MKNNILITWTSRWLGRFLAEKLSEENNVIWISRKKLDQKKFLDLNFDLTDFSKFDEIIEKIKEQKFWTIILNGWIWYFWEFQNWENYEEIINLNLLSPILFLQKILPFLEEKANIIFIWSIISKKFMKWASVYQASKFWLRGFAWWLKNELKWKKIFLINPKILETDFHKNSTVFIPTDESKITSLESIFEVVKNILENNENRFEIDL